MSDTPTTLTDLPLWVEQRDVMHLVPDDEYVPEEHEAWPFEVKVYVDTEQAHQVVWEGEKEIEKPWPGRVKGTYEVFFTTEAHIEVRGKDIEGTLYIPVLDCIPLSGALVLGNLYRVDMEKLHHWLEKLGTWKGVWAPSKMMPNSDFGVPMTIDISGKDARYHGPTESEFCYYHCTEETGRFIAFWMYHPETFEPLTWSQAQRLFTVNSKKAPRLIKAYLAKDKQSPKRWYVFEWVGIGLITTEDPPTALLEQARLVIDG
jgi:hypothetical protein